MDRQRTVWLRRRRTRSQLIERLAAKNHHTEEFLAKPIVLAEVEQRPRWFRRLERLAGSFRKRGTYGPAQVMATTPLPNGIDCILDYVARKAAGYSTGLKKNEVDKLKADMMNRPDRWKPVTVEQVRAKCKELGMRPNDVDAIAELLQRRKDERSFRVDSSCRGFHF